MLEELFKKQIYTIGFKVKGDCGESDWQSLKILADSYEDAKKYIDEYLWKDLEVIFNDYSPYNIENVSDYVTEDTIIGLLLNRDVIIGERV